MSKNEYDYTEGALEGEPTKTYSYLYENAWKDQLTSFDGQSITYDAAGNPTSYLGATLTWSRGRLLTRFAKGLNNISISYNANGVRRSKVNFAIGSRTSTSYIYDANGKLRSETDGTYTRRYLYSADGIMGFEENGVLYLYRKNLFGDITAIYQGSTKVAAYTYDAWGNCKIASSTTNYAVALANPFRYRGYYYDSDTNLYYLNARYYSPEFRRFISPDNTAYIDPKNVNGCNLYCYCGNDPVNFVDPSGNEVITATIGIGLVLLYAFAVLSLTAIVAISGNTNIETENIPNNIFDTDVESTQGAIRDLIILYVASLAIKRHYDTEEKHHIVARKDWRALPSRIILDLKDVNIGVDDPENLVWMKKGYHRVLHTDLYYAILNYSMATAYLVNRKEGVLWLLDTYREILGGL